MSLCRLSVLQMCPPSVAYHFIFCVVSGELKGLCFNVAQLILPSLYSLCPLCSAKEIPPYPEIIAFSSLRLSERSVDLSFVFQCLIHLVLLLI